jgi:hypothetical protein
MVRLWVIRWSRLLLHPYCYKYYGLSGRSALAHTGARVSFLNNISSHKTTVTRTELSPAVPPSHHGKALLTEPEGDKRTAHKTFFFIVILMRVSHPFPLSFGYGNSLLRIIRILYSRIRSQCTGITDQTVADYIKNVLSACSAVGKVRHVRIASSLPGQDRKYRRIAWSVRG